MSSRNDLYDVESTPLEQRRLPSSTYALLQNSAERFGDKTALRFLPVGASEAEVVLYSYSGLFASITQTANAFMALGIGRKDCVSMLLPNLPQTHFTIWGAEAVGIVNPLNPLLDTAHLAAIMNEVESKVLVTMAPASGSDLWDKALQLVDRVPSLSTVLVVGLAARSDSTKELSQEDRNPDTTLPCQILDFDEYVAGFDRASLSRNSEVNADTRASLFHTGGTTGTPKLAPHTHGNEVAMAWQLANTMDIDSDTVALCGLPLFHVNAVFVTGLTPWLVGAEVVLASPQGYRDPTIFREFWALVEKYRVSYFSAVPTILSDLLEVDSDAYDLSSLEFCACGAAPLSVELVSQFEARTGLVVLEGYGQTEGCCVSTTNPRYGERRVGSVGRRLPYLQLRTVVLDEESSYVRDCSVDEVGSILIKGPNVFGGYTKAEHNAELWPQEGWFKTGDLGRLDAEGYLWLTGRSKDLIIRGGHNIDPQSIEEALYKHPAVAAVAAVGKPDPRLGELPVAYVQLSGAASEIELLQFARDHINERAAVPKEIHIIDALPLTAVGKISKPELRNDIIRRIVESELDMIGDLMSSDYTVAVEVSERYGQLALIGVKPTVRVQSEIKRRLDAYRIAYRFKE